MDSKVIILLGSNLDDPAVQLELARTLLEKNGLPILSTSSIYRTSAWGNEQQNDFLNQVLVLKTGLEPLELLRTLLSIELEMGRVRYKKWGPRIIDIDILFYEDLVINMDGLHIPHPEIQNRRFTLQPLNEILPEMKHPILGKTLKELLEDCIDKGQAEIDPTLASR